MSILAVFTYLVWRAARGKKKDSTALQQRLRQNDIAEAERKTLLETEQNGAAGTPHKHKKKETGFTGQIGFVMAAAGSAVGVGNLWRFPYLAAKDGGGLFIIIYLILALTFGFTLLTSDIAVGRRTGMNSIRAYESMNPKWKFLGIITFLVPAIIMTYYAVIGGWITRYIAVYLAGQGEAAAADSFFTDFITSPGQSSLCAVLFMLLTAWIVFNGVEKGIEKCSRVLMPEVYCDETRITQLLLNLLSNAVKYTPSGGEVCLEILQEPFIGNRKYCRYRFRVSDNGIGISREFLSHVFEPFERESGRIGSTSYGSGLGMSIAKGIVDLMGGNINVESEEDAGTVVTVELEFRPFREAGGAQEETDAAEAAQNTEQISSDDLAVFQENPASAGRKNADVGWIEGRRLLLVEDNPLNREIAEEMLTEDGFKVESAENGRRALQRIVENDPWYYSAVLMDIQMPIMDGYETTERIRALPDRSRAHIPIIAMTANAFKEDRIKAAESGMDAYITKPVDVLALRYVLRRVLR